MEFTYTNPLEGIEHCSPFISDGVVIGTPFFLNQLVHRFGREIIPDELGIYHLFYHDQLIYIGMAKNLQNRLMGHLKDPDMPFNGCLWFVASQWKEDATIADVLKIEYRMIKKHRPVLNERGLSHISCPTTA